MRIALAQISSGPDPRENLGTVREEIARAAAEGAEVVVFPEAAMKAFGASLRGVAEDLDGPWARAVQQAAEDHGVLVVAGMFTPASPAVGATPEVAAKPRVRNTMLVTGRGLHAGYDKVHMYDAFGFQESRTVEPGPEACLVRVPGTEDDVALGLAICYDVRFPGLFTALTRAGARAHVLIASWQDGPGKADQWELAVRARAMDTATWVVACGQAVPPGATPGESTGAPTGVGRSLVVDPMGTVVHRLGTGPELAVHDVDLSADTLEEAREALPVLANTRDIDEVRTISLG